MTALTRRYGIWSSTAVMVGGVAVLDGLMAGLTLLGATLVTAWGALRSKTVQAWMRRYAARHAANARRDRRDAALETAAIPKHGLAFAPVLVDRIIDSDPTIERYIDLESLLDRYVELELAISRCLQIDLAPPCPQACSETRLRIRDHGLALRRDSETRLANAREELASITELLRLILARSELAKVELHEDPVADTVALLECAE